MTVKELINHLGGFNPDYEVKLLQMHDKGPDDYTDLTTEDFSIDDEFKQVEIIFPELT